MKRVISVAFFTLLISTIAWGQVKSKSHAKQYNKVEQAIKQIEREFADDSVKGSTASIQHYMTNNYICVEPDGTVTTKSGQFEMFSSEDVKYESLKFDQMKVRIFGDTAIATLQTTEKYTYKGNDESGQYRWTDVFVKHGGKWMLVSSHGTKIAVK